MIDPRQGYLLGVGSNVDPQRNALRIIDSLRRRFGEIVLSRFHETAPVGMDSDHRFINFCAYVPTALDPEACKQACVEIEIALGRDRTHPARKTRDRTADIDLLVRVGPDGGRFALEPIAPYLAEPAAEIIASLESLRWESGEAPTAVDGNDGAGLKGVGQERINGDADRLDTAFLAQ